MYVHSETLIVYALTLAIHSTYTKNMKDKHTTIRLDSTTKRLLTALKVKLKRPSASNVIEWLIAQEAERQKLK